MNGKTHLEDLSNEIFCEIFDYLHMLHTFTGFALLNQRISNILKSIPLHINISFENSRQQIDFLLSHLTFHEDQVISINTLDRIRDHSSVIHLLFNRHNFTNLKSCKFVSIYSMTKLNNIIKQIGNLDKLVILQIYQPDRLDLNENNNDELTRILLTNKSLSLRSLKLQYPNHYLNISNYTFINSNIISLCLRISGSSSTVSVYTILQIFRVCYRIRYLCIALQHEKRFENNINVSNHLSSINATEVPILSQLTYFHLRICALCDIWSISSILNCMPNLKQFYFFLLILRPSFPFTNQYLDGHVWQQILENNVSYLSKFEFHMTVTKRRPKVDLDIFINSFSYFVTKYSNWNMVVDRWMYGPRLQVNFRETTNDNNGHENLTYLSNFIYLTNITTLEFPPIFHVNQTLLLLTYIFCFRSCPKVIILAINTSVLLSSKIINNLTLIPVFKQIKMIKLITEDIYFPSNFILQFVERFPSLVHIELQVFSFDICSFIIEVLLTQSEQLSYVKINYHQDTLLDDYFTREYITTKRRQVFPLNIINQQMMNVKNNGQTIEIWLS
ncbi:unnamed protein product [Adineta steineri]|uniref:F-box domain-containing protein n=1 Tax=Adineta steineri TaxID=433720 RepID=A0A814I9M2_9BILA|nr:unnamed protein product [Adineta steineri]CAF1215808.1 unnamed protein product [Adineta steineri]